jgi:hypothetical protein
MTDNLTDLFPRGHIPQLDQVIHPGGNERAAVGSKEHVTHMARACHYLNRISHLHTPLFCT